MRTPPRPGKVDPRLDGDGHAGGQCTGAERAQGRRLVDLQARRRARGRGRTARPWPAAAITSRAAASTAATSAPTAQRRPAGGLRGGDQLVDLALPVGRRAEHEVRVMSEW